jgi:hypothetical protein
MVSPHVLHLLRTLDDAPLLRLRCRGFGSDAASDSLSVTVK